MTQQIEKQQAIVQKCDCDIRTLRREIEEQRATIQRCDFGVINLRQRVEKQWEIDRVKYQAISLKYENNINDLREPRPLCLYFDVLI